LGDEQEAFLGGEIGVLDLQKGYFPIFKKKAKK
jgi:hypothetical protein